MSLKMRRMLKKGIAFTISILLIAFLLIEVLVFQSEAVGNYEQAWFPAPQLYVTQLAYESYSHGVQNAIDIVPGGDVFAPFTGKVVYRDPRWGFVALQSLDKVYFADGSLDYMTVAFMHDTDISDIQMDQVFQQGEPFYQAGGMGAGDPNAYGTHVHVCVWRGWFTPTNSNGNGGMYAYDALFVNPERTTVVKEGQMESGNTMTNGAPSDYSGKWNDDIYYPEIIGNTVESTGATCFADGNEGFQITFTARDNKKIQEAYAKVWQFNETEADAVKVPGNFTSQANTDVPVTINVKLNQFGNPSGEGIYYWKLYLSDGHNLTSYVVDPENNYADFINLFSITPDEKSYGSYKVVTGTKLRVAPYEKWNGKDTQISALPEGEVISVIGRYTNSHEHDWYQTEDGQWVYGARLKKYTNWMSWLDKVKGYKDQVVYWINGKLVKGGSDNTKSGARVMTVRAADNSRASFRVIGTVQTTGSTGTTPSVNYATVSFDPNGGSCSRTSVSYQAGVSYGWLPSASRFGYTFDGWFTSAEDGTQVTAGDTCPASGTTLYAHWTRVILLQGSCGPNMNFVLYGDGELDITGSGEMTSHPWTDNYKAKVFYVKMEGDITSVADSTFDGCNYLHEVTIPDSVLLIGANAFRNCANLASVELPDNIQTLRYWAFRNCTSLTHIFIPKTLETAESATEGPFEGCSNLISAEIEPGMTEIPAKLFRKSGLTTITIPNSVTKIGSSVFSNCVNLKTISIPNSVTEIDANAFVGCANLASVELSKNIQTLRYWAFRNCTSLTHIFIPKTLETAESATEGPFEGCSNLISAEIEPGMTEIPAKLFRKSGLTTITIPNSVTKIGSSVFSNCVNLKTISIPNSVTEIDANAFVGCANLASVELSKNIQTLRYWAFRNCTSLTHIFIPKTLETAESATEGPFEGCSNLISAEIEPGMTEIPAKLFRKSGLTTITIPNSVTEIGAHAFYNCSNLASVVIPDTVQEAGNYAFSGCSSLTEVKLPDSMTIIGTGLLRGCSSLTKVTLPKGITVIPSEMFKGCTALEAFALPSTVATISSYAFQSCVSLKQFTWGESLKTIGTAAFSDCDAMTKIALPGTVTTVNNSAFSNCDALETVTLGDGLTALSSKLFYDCDALTSVTLGSGIKTVGDSVFEHCDVLERLVLPYKVTTVGSNVFKDCVQFKSLTIPRATTSIQTNAVSYPEILTIYGVAGTTAESYANQIGAAFVAIDHPVQSITLSSTEVTLNRSATIRLTPTISPADFTDAITWKSSDTSVATVDADGVVKGVGVGTAKISVIGGNVKATCTVTVVQPVTGISLNKTALSLEAGNTFRLTATVSPSNANNKTVVWTSSDKTVATVSPEGIVTALKKGTATITCAAQDGSGISKSCTVTVPNSLISVAEVKDLQSAHPYAVNCSDIWIYQKPGAESLRVTFSENTSVEEDSDYLYLFDAAGNQIGKYTGDALAGVTVEIPGDTVKIKLVSDSSYCEYGFAVTAVEADMGGVRITAQPQDVSTVIGAQPTFSVTAEGSGLTYQWYFKKAGATSWSKWSGRTSATATGTVNSTWDGMQVRCVITDENSNTATSDPATVTLALKITAQPQNVTVSIGDKATFSVTAEGKGLTYQWYVLKTGSTKWTAWTGRTTATITGTVNSTWDGMQVRCVVKDANGNSVTSSTATVTLAPTLKITSQPKSATLANGANASFSVTAEGAGLTYQWYFKKAGATSWSKWSGRTSATATGTVNSTWDGMQVRCVVKDKYGNTVTSGTATVTIASAIKITAQPQSVSTLIGAKPTFTVKAEGSGLKYQWYFKKAGATAWSKWSGRMEPTATGTVNSTWDGMQVRCVITDSKGNTVTTNAATITLALKITSQPQSITTSVGEKATFSVKAEGKGLTYQWYVLKTGSTKWTAWTGRTTATISGTVNSTWNGMQVRCVVKDADGRTVTSGIAKVTLK